MDDQWHKDMTVKEAMALLKSAIAQMKKRFLLSFDDVTFQMVKADGIYSIEPSDKEADGFVLVDDK